MGVSFYRTSGSSTRAKCANCLRPFKEHKYVATDRDGELHACPAAVLWNRDAVSEGEVAAALDGLKEMTREIFKIGRYGFTRPLSNGGVLRVTLTMPALAAAKKVSRKHYARKKRG